MLTTILSAVGAYCATNLDAVALLVALLAARPERAVHIWGGLSFSMAVLTGTAYLCALVGIFLPSPYFGLLGFVPMCMGIARLGALLLRHSTRNGVSTAPTSHLGLAAATLIFIASGGDNLAVYIPLFSSASAAGRAVTVLVFATMTVALIFIVEGLLSRPRTYHVVQRFGMSATPLLLMALGTSTVLRSGGLDFAVTGLIAAL